MHAATHHFSDSMYRFDGRAAVAPGPLFQREGDYWRVGWEGSISFVPNVCGMAYLGRLLARPGEAIHVVDLIHVGARHGAPASRWDDAMAMSNDSDCGEHLDRRAREAYRQRIGELQRLLQGGLDLDEERVLEWRSEVEFLHHELNRGLGLGGRLRRAGSFSERARINVTRAVREAVRRIERADAGLGCHLDRSLRTGVYCSYLPRPATVAWVL